MGQNVLKKIMKENTAVVSAVEPVGTDRKKVWFKKGKNLFNKNNVISNVNLLANGSIESDTLSSIHYIEVVGGQIYSLSSNVDRQWVFNTSAEKLSSSTQGSQRTVTSGTSVQINVPSGHKYINIRHYSNLEEDNINQNIQLEQNPVATTYEAYVEPEIYILNSNNVYEKMYGNSVAENGENGYFKYIKFSDGTLIQYGTMIFNNLTWNSWGSLYYAECNVSQYKFPVPFIDKPVVNGSIAHGTGSGDGWISRIGGTSTTDIESLAIARPTTYADSMYVNITAIGRWK